MKLKKKTNFFLSLDLKDPVNKNFLKIWKKGKKRKKTDFTVLNYRVFIFLPSFFLLLIVVGFNGIRFDFDSGLVFVLSHFFNVFFIVFFGFYRVLPSFTELIIGLTRLSSDFTGSLHYYTTA